MSHKSSVNLKVNDKEALKRALDNLGFKYSEGKQVTKGQYGVEENVEIRLEGYKNKSGGSNLTAIGFAKNKDGTYQCTGDFWGLNDSKGKKITEESFSQALNQRYSYEKIQSELVTNGFTIDSDFVNDKGEIEIEATIWV